MKKCYIKGRNFYFFKKHSIVVIHIFESFKIKKTVNHKNFPPELFFYAFGSYVILAGHILNIFRRVVPKLLFVH